MTRVLHLSDLHFGESHHFSQGHPSGSRSTAAEAVQEALGSAEAGPVDWLVVSGDWFSKDLGKDLAHAKDGLKQLIGSLGVDPQKVLCVPGNHDLTWESAFSNNKFRFYDELVESVPGVRGVTDDLPLIVSEPATTGAPRPLAFVLMNSSRLETKSLAGIGEIGSTQMKAAKEQLLGAGISSETHTIIAVIHHHLLPIVAREKYVQDQAGTASQKVETPSLVLDAVAALQGLAEMGVSLVMHGHQHKPAILRYQDVLHHRPPLLVLAAGSCASKEGVRRQFFTLESRESEIDIRSFQESSEDEDRFVPSERTSLPVGSPLAGQSIPSLELPLATHVNGSNGIDAQSGLAATFCEADTHGRNVALAPELEQTEEERREDTSDLYVMMLSVADCPKARDVVRTAIRDLPKERVWKGMNPQVALLGMYDLLGNWDLCVRLRIARGANPTSIRGYLERRLEKEGLRRNKGLFSASEELNVTHEAPSIRQLRTRGAALAHRRMLGSTEDYDRLRCQRSFVWIDLGVSHDPVLQELAKAVEEEPEVAAIIESASLSAQTLLLETFSACGQSTEIARLNRQIEPVLATWGRQKYTLSCYGYDEESLVVPVLEASVT
jgi:predicted phosphodiesterase